MDKFCVEGDEFVRDLGDRLKSLIDTNVRNIVERAAATAEAEGASIDVDDSSEVGELITRNGWSLFDMNLEISDVVDDITDHFSVRELVRKYDSADVMRCLFNEEGDSETIALFMAAARQDSTDEAIIEELKETGLNIRIDAGEEIDVWLQHNPGDALNKMGEQVVMELVEQFGWGKKVEKPKTVVIGDLEWTEKLRDLNWFDAFDEAVKMGNGWRLPTIQELVALYDYKEDRCAAFPESIGGLVWSAHNPNDEIAFTLDTVVGVVHRTDNREMHLARFVRTVKKGE